jgi:Helix-turn-helix domain
MSAKALRCVLEHLTTRLDDNRRRVAMDKLRGPIQHVAVWMAWHAHDDGGGIWAAQPTIATEAGISRRTVQRALDELEAAKVVEKDEHGGKRGTNRYRIRLCALCVTDTQEALYASERRGTRVRETHKPNKNTALTDQQRLAMLNATPPAPRDLAPPGSGGRSRPAPWNPPTARPEASRVLPNSSGHAFAVVREDDPAEPEWREEQAWSEAPVAPLLPFPADRASRPAAAGGTA